MRRFRLTFTKGQAVRYISHLDLMRTWERSLRRAGLKLAHSQGFNPRPRLVFAAPLPVGATSDAEIVDVDLDEDVSLEELTRRLPPALPPGIELRAAVEAPLQGRSLMASVLSADYVVELDGAADLAVRIQEFLARPSVLYERRRKGVAKQADMRPAVLDLWPVAEDKLGMRLRLDVEGLAVRPEELVAALDGAWRVRRVHRTALSLNEQRDAA
jgi:radical SAM-linked protein